MKNIIFFAFLCMGTQIVMAAGPNKNLPKFFQRTTTEIKNPMELRDPFKRRVQKLKSSSRGGKGENRTLFSNMATLDNVPLDKIQILGVILGDSRSAIARIASDKPEEVSADSLKVAFTTYIITEGMKLGINNAEVRAILPGGIVLVEKIRNVYDQEEYIETIIPVTVD